MSTSQIRIRKDIHIKLKEVADKEGKKLQEVSDEFLLYALKNYSTDEVMKETAIEKILNTRLDKTEELILKGTERLASLQARVGIDNSMALMGIVTLIEKILDLDKKAVQNELRKQGAIYFSNAVKEDKEKKKEGK